MAEYTLPLLGWILYVAVPLASLVWVTYWYLKRQKNNKTRAAGGEPQ